MLATESALYILVGCVKLDAFSFQLCRPVSSSLLALIRRRLRADRRWRLSGAAAGAHRLGRGARAHAAAHRHVARIDWSGRAPALPDERRHALQRLWRGGAIDASRVARALARRVPRRAGASWCWRAVAVAAAAHGRGFAAVRARPRVQSGRGVQRGVRASASLLPLRLPLRFAPASSGIARSLQEQVR